MPNKFVHLYRYFFTRWKSDREGVSIIPNGRDGMKYTENDHSVEVYTELLMGRVERLIHSNSIDKWMPPHENEALTEEDRKRIIAELCSRYAYYGTTHQIKE